MNAAGFDEGGGIEKSAVMDAAALKRRVRLVEQIRIWREEL